MFICLDVPCVKWPGVCGVTCRCISHFHSLITAYVVQCRDDLVKDGKVKPTFLVQGTLYPDVIESCPPPGSTQKHSHTIKSHHNVGGLPKDLQFELLEPLRELFKDEVRQMGRLLGVPEVRLALSQCCCVLCVLPSSVFFLKSL